MKTVRLGAISLIPALLYVFVQPVFAQDFTVFTNTPPTSSGIDTSLANLINTATASVDATIYSLDRQVIVDALFNAQSRGVPVRIVAEADSYYSSVYGPSFWYLETQGGIPIVLDTASGGGSAIMHDKFYIIDGTKVWTGSYNPTNSGTVADSNNAILINNVDLAQAYSDEFNEMFISHLFGAQKSDNTSHSFTINGYEVESYFSPSDGVSFQIQSEIDAAAHSVYFLIFSFTDDDVANRLIARYQGDLIVQGAFDASQRNQTGGEYSRLRSAGIPVKKDDFTGLLHHKLMIFDPGQTDCAVITGSSNWSFSAFNRNDEDIVIIRDPSVVNQYYGIFRDIYDNHCVEEGGAASGAIVINEIMSTGEEEDIPAGERSNWGESKEDGGSPGDQGEPDTLPPVIVHTPIDRTLINRPISIHCEIYDPNDPEMYSAKDPTLYYRRRTPGYSFQTASLGALYGKYSGTIPATAVTADGVEYYLSARDWSYNLATSPSFSPQSNPYQVDAVSDPDAVIRFTEIMYDPPGDVEDETVYEWVEIQNVSASQTVSLNGWEFTDGEGTYPFPSSASISAGERQILCKTASGPSGSFTRYIYGPDSVGEINLGNPMGVVTDELILKDETELIMDEVDYSANWGASNLAGPNEHTLEKVDPEGENDEDNWLYSMVEGGTPGAANSPHFIFHTYYLQTGYQTRPGIWINPTMISPGDAECTVYYRLDRNCDVTVKAYNPPDEVSPEHCYDQEYFLVTLLSNVAKTANLDPTLYAPHTVTWDGTYGVQSDAVGNCRIVVEAAWSGQTCVCDSDDTLLSSMYHKVGSGYYNVFYHEPVQIYFYQSKPAFVTLDIEKKLGTQQWTHVRNLVNGVAMPRPPDGETADLYLWDGRYDNGMFIEPFSQTKEDIDIDDIFGNVVIVRPPLRILDVAPNPRSHFDPHSGTSAKQTQKINYSISQGASVSINIYNAAGNVVATPLNWTNQTASSYSMVWDGTDGQSQQSNGIYTFTIEAQGVGQKTQFSGKVCLFDSQL